MFPKLTLEDMLAQYREPSDPELRAEFYAAKRLAFEDLRRRTDRKLIRAHKRRTESYGAGVDEES